MSVKQLIYLLVPTIALSTPIPSKITGDSDNSGSGYIFGAAETTTSPGGFSAVAEPAGPSSTKSTEQSPPPKPQARSTSTSLTPTALLHKFDLVAVKESFKLGKFKLRRRWC